MKTREKIDIRSQLGKTRNLGNSGGYSEIRRKKNMIFERHGHVRKSAAHSESRLLIRSHRTATFIVDWDIRSHITATFVAIMDPDIRSHIKAHV